MDNNIMDDLKNKRIVILGFAREGKSTLAFLKKHFPHKEIGIYDQTLTDVDINEFVKGYDCLIKSAGIPIKILSKENLKKITTPTNIFFDLCPGKIIGVTGTKGKSTTAGLIYEIIKAANQKTVLLGNMGKPCLDYLDRIDENTWVVFELSSHQLATINKSPHIAVFLNLFPDHLDFFTNLKQYYSAKANIIKDQTEKDYLIYDVTDKNINKFTEISKAKKIPIRINRFKTSLLGAFNQFNISAAASVAKIIGISKDNIEEGVRNFKSIPHRLELVGTYRGLTFYNDSQATIPEPTIAAIKALGDKVETLLLGGYEKKVKYGNLAEIINESQIKNLILFPPTGPKIFKLLKDKTKYKVWEAKSMKEAVALAYEHTRRGKIVLLSTACASFGMFKSYEDRGNQFKEEVLCQS